MILVLVLITYIGVIVLIVRNYDLPGYQWLLVFYVAFGGTIIMNLILNYARGVRS